MSQTTVSNSGSSGLAGKVPLPGHIADDDLASHFEACEVFCMPSTVRAEVYGVAMLEAMVMAKPVVTEWCPEQVAAREGVP